MSADAEFLASLEVAERFGTMHVIHRFVARLDPALPVRAKLVAIIEADQRFRRDVRVYRADIVSTIDLLRIVSPSSPELAAVRRIEDERDHARRESKRGGQLRSIEARIDMWRTDEAYFRGLMDLTNPNRDHRMKLELHVNGIRPLHTAAKRLLEAARAQPETATERTARLLEPMFIVAAEEIARTGEDLAAYDQRLAR